MNQIYFNASRYILEPQRLIAQGNEAEVYDVVLAGLGLKAVKWYKGPDHPDYAHIPDDDERRREQEGAALRLEQHQQKLRGFPKGLPPAVIAPEVLGTEDMYGQKVTGFAMRRLMNPELLMRFAEPDFREKGIGMDVVKTILTRLHPAVVGIHQHQGDVVIGDFNHLNVMVVLGPKGPEVYIIDADSMSYAGFNCVLYNVRFVDPLLCDPNAKAPLLIQPHNKTSDWYAYNVMALENLTFMGPYDGIYRPKDHRKRIPHDQRPLHRITIFDPEVIIPQWVIHYSRLPDELLEHFYQTFVKDKRGEFPLSLLTRMRWTKCTQCGALHARVKCPECALAAPAAVKEVVRGKVSMTRVFSTSGTILFADYQGGKLLWLYHGDGKLRREDGRVVGAVELDPTMRFRLQGENTLIGQHGRLLTLQPDGQVDQLVVDSFQSLAMFGANSTKRFWLHNGQLWGDGSIGPEYVGDVLKKQTLFWVGEDFGFGFYRAGRISVAFVFDTSRRGINDTLEIPPIRGQLLDSTCFFSNGYCWFISTVQEGSETINHCSVIRKDGTVEATASAKKGDGSWLGTLRGKCAIGNSLLAATDQGIVRVQLESGEIAIAAEFPDTQTFVHSGVHLFPGPGGLYVVSRREVRLLKIRQ